MNQSLNSVKNPKYYGYRRGLLQRFINFLIKSLWVVLLHVPGHRP